MKTMLPGTRPEAVYSEVESRIYGYELDRSKFPVVLLGVRGYYRDSMGERGKNDRALYDDALFLSTAAGAGAFFRAYNANTDPAAYRKGIANLCPGVWHYRLGVHGLSKPKLLQYEALVQASEVRVLRDDAGYDRGFFGINIHRGGAFSVSSLGCQTVPPSQWKEFIQSVRDELSVHRQSVIPYILHDRKGESRV